MRRGVWQGLLAYTIWGLFPIYWKLFHDIPALEVLAHRILWSFVALAVILVLLWPARLRALKGQPWRSVALYAAAAVLIGVNWFLYIWGVNAGFVVETSLGYFMTPLVNVLLGVAVFRERLSTWQWLAVALAAAGMVYLTNAYGAVPWIALGLAVSFGSYGLAKKKAPLPALDGLMLETTLLVLPAFAYLAVLHGSGQGSFFRVATPTELFLVAGGLITVTPLLLFASAVRRVPLSIMGLLQYVSPTIQLVLGVLVFKEPFTRVQLTGFGFVWAGLALFAADSFKNRRRNVGDEPGWPQRRRGMET
jgi:chloramphenicol-sensitive protein RarD